MTIFRDNIRKYKKIRRTPYNGRSYESTTTLRNVISKLTKETNAMFRLLFPSMHKYISSQKFQFRINNFVIITFALIRHTFLQHFLLFPFPYISTNLTGIY